MDIPKKKAEALKSMQHEPGYCRRGKDQHRRFSQPCCSTLASPECLYFFFIFFFFATDGFAKASSAYLARGLHLPFITKGS